MTVSNGSCPAKLKEVADTDPVIEVEPRAMAPTASVKGGDSAGQALPQPKRPMSLCTWNIMLVIGVFIYSSYTIFVHLCEKDGKIPFSSASMVFVTELVKLTMSLSMLLAANPEWRTCRPLLPVCSPEAAAAADAASAKPSLGHGQLRLGTVLPFAVPAVLYSFNNNLAVYIQLQMDPATYQVLANLKILTTAFLFRLIIKRPIEKLQWVALGMLLFAGVFNSFGGMASKGKLGDQAMSAGVVHITMQGLVMILAYCTISGFSGVYTEYVLKKQKDMSLHLQNSLLYIFGLILNFAIFIFQAEKGHSADLANPFRGYSIYTWLLILTQAFGGIMMGAIMKYANNITRLFLISSAMVVTTLLSVAIFGLKLNLYFISSMLLVIFALCLYHKPTS